MVGAEGWAVVGWEAAVEADCGCAGAAEGEGSCRWEGDLEEGEAVGGWTVPELGGVKGDVGLASKVEMVGEEIV